MIIAIDGPAASGKGTLSRKLAKHYGLAHLDTGSLYRKVAYLILQAGGDPADAATGVATARTIADHAVDENALRTEGVGAAASLVASNQAVREELKRFQRWFCANPPSLPDGSPSRGAVLDGRDIGTVICPDAPVKLFVTANAETRARRRNEETLKRGGKTTYEAALADIKARDARDSSRAVSPLKPARDAHLLDTTDLSIEAAFKAACALVDATLIHDAASRTQNAGSKGFG